MTEAMKSASCTHNHDEGIKGAMSIAVCIYLARNKTSKKIIKEIVEIYFDYDLNRKLNEIRPNYGFDVSCQGSVPEAIICFLESTDYEDCIRNAISLGGDSDTQACIAGSIAEAYYKDDKSLVDIIGVVSSKIPQDMNVIIKQFYERINDTNENT